jgi:NAD(P)-dependent dehydrogenase (short-subunit alcohol dehydrogenase family)
MNVKDSVALVTGANRGIGASIVEALLARGAKKVYAAMRQPTPALDARVVPIALDITNEERIARLAQELGDVDILINNAGIAHLEPLVGATRLDAAAEEMKVNYFGPLAMVRAFAPILRKNGGGAIVNVLSILSRVNAPRLGSYSASKAAAFSLTQGIRAELAKQGTLVVGVMPGFVDTDMARAATGPKVSPNDVAESIIDAIERGVEDVYPGEEAARVAAALLHDPKAVEKGFAARFV